MSNPKDYTVGWICAISTEYVAAQAFLDEEHEGPKYVSPRDNNDYTLGKVGKHNVVIAVLPDGEYGTSSAASVARDMLHSFPNVRIGLMVGIGGGAPSPKHDIRLGDIVVSAPCDGEGGVFQYDFGKTIQNQSFQQTRFLNQPPTVLRTAVSGLKAQYERKGHQLEKAITSILKGNPRLQQKYKRPDPSSDKQYQPGVTHPPDSEASCAAVCGDDPSNLILRPERTEDEDNPAFHYGLIASANQLMKDASIRDTLAAEKNVLCFEMEAAGLMNHFPCLVIRGVCDYSDSHKNTEWQGYAAMAAAAYTKDLLCRIPPNRVEAEKRISDILSDVQEGVNELLRGQHDQEHDTILNWLTGIDYAPQQNDYIRRRQPGTGQWLLDSAEFQTWLYTSKQTLFCPGIPGAGKTILTSIVVDDLCNRFRNDKTIGIAYIYCNFRRQDEQKVEDLLASLLKELAQYQPSLSGIVKDLYDRHKDKRTRPSFDDLSRALQSVASMYSRVFIVVDALDECQVSDGCRPRLLSEVFNLQTKAGANVFATSRFIPEITEKFEWSTTLKIRARDEDVRSYLDGHMETLPSFVRGDPNLQGEIKTKIVGAVEGMFLLAQLYLDSLIGKRSPKAIRTALKNLRKESKASSNDDQSKALYDAYKEAMERIKRQNGDSPELAKQVLSWITCGKRSLTTLELRHALAVEMGESELDETNLPGVEDMVSMCAGLVTVDEQSNIIRLVHYTTQQFLETNMSWLDAQKDIVVTNAQNGIAMTNSQTNITKTCVTYLTFDCFGTGFCATDEEFEARLQLYSLYDYAARNWGHHARAASTEVEKLILGLLESETKKSAASQAMLASREGSWDSDYSQGVPRQMTGIHLAAYFGLTGVIMALLKNRHNPDVKDTYNRSPLSWAAENGHEAVVNLLLEKGAEPESKDGIWGRTPLSWAAIKGHEAVVNLLLEKGAELESKDGDGRTPLLQAAKNGHEAVVNLLLEKGAELESNDIYGQTPLSQAAIKGHEAVVNLLLKKGAELESKDKYGQTPLSWAARNGHEAVVKLLTSIT